MQSAETYCNEVRICFLCIFDSSNISCSLEHCIIECSSALVYAQAKDIDLVRFTECE